MLSNRKKEAMSETTPSPNIILEPKEWSNILENILDSADFKTQIDNHGYYLSPEYADFRTYLKKEWNLNSTINTANFLSKDFWHEQSRILRNHNFLF